MTVHRAALCQSFMQNYGGWRAIISGASGPIIPCRLPRWKNRAHFCGIAARLMRQILIEHARAHNADKRGGRLEKLYLEETRHLSKERAPDLLALDDALKTFATSHPRESEVVELKFFGGLEAREIAEVLNVSAKTVSRDWSFAKLWLLRQLSNAA
jgi:RNA polymerase sigma-70 factor (ECF subfamily)